MTVPIYLRPLVWEMSFKRYMNLGQEAVLNFHQGHYRESADKYLEAATSAAPGTWAENRWHIFHGYTSILREKYFAPTERDLQALDHIIHDKSEGRLFRAEAAFTRGLLLWDVGERNQAAELYREAIRIGEKVSDKERQRRVMSSTDSGGIALRTVGDVIAGVVKGARDNLTVLEQPLNSRPIIGQQKRSDGTFVPADIRYSYYGPIASICQLSKQGFDRLLTVGGAECDHCGKKREDLGSNHLKSCSRCLRAFYCSQDCQKRQWKAGHKEACRKPGEILNGDLVKLKKLVSKPELNGRVVKAIRPLESQPGRWKVQIDDRTFISVATENLEQLRALY